MRFGCLLGLGAPRCFRACLRGGGIAEVNVVVVDCIAAFSRACAVLLRVLYLAACIVLVVGCIADVVVVGEGGEGSVLSPDLLVVITVVGIVVVVVGVVVANLFREVQAGAVLLGRRSAASTSVSTSVIQHLSVPVPTHLPGIQNLSIPVPTHLPVDCFVIIAMSMPPLEMVWGPERCPRCACSHAWVVVVIEVVVGVVDVVVVIVVGVVIAVSL